MKVRARYSHWFPRKVGALAITLYPWVLFSMPKSEALPVAKHEVVHVRQVRALGWLRFYVSYGWQWLKAMVCYWDYWRAYSAVLYEQEAYAQQANNELTPEELAEFEL